MATDAPAALEAAYAAWDCGRLSEHLIAVDSIQKEHIFSQAQSWASDETKTPLQKLVAGRVAMGLGSKPTAAKCFAAAFVSDSCLRKGDDFGDLQAMCAPAEDLFDACELGIDAAEKMIEAALSRGYEEEDNELSPESESTVAERPAPPPGDVLKIGRRFFDEFIDDVETMKKVQMALFFVELCWATRYRTPLFQSEPKASSDGPMYADVGPQVISGWRLDATAAGRAAAGANLTHSASLVSGSIAVVAASGSDDVFGDTRLPALMESVLAFCKSQPASALVAIACAHPTWLCCARDGRMNHNRLLQSTATDSDIVSRILSSLSDLPRCLVHPDFPVATPEHALCRMLPTAGVAHGLRIHMRNLSRATRSSIVAPDFDPVPLDVDPTPAVVFTALSGLRALHAELNGVLTDLCANAEAAHVYLADVHAAAHTATSNGTGDIAWIDAERDRLAAAIDAARDLKVHSLEARLVSVDEAAASLEHAATTASAAADDAALSDNDLVKAWSATCARTLQAALSRSAVASLSPWTSATLFLTAGPDGPSPALASVATAFVTPQNVRVSGLRRVMLAVTPGEALSFTVEVADESMLAKWCDIKEATRELLRLLRVDAVSAESVPRPRAGLLTTHRPKGDHWACPECGYRNFESEACELCDFGSSASPGLPPPDVLSGTPLVASMSLDLQRPCIHVSVTLPSIAPGLAVIATAAAFVVVQSITVDGRPILFDLPAAAIAPSILAPYAAVYNDHDGRNSTHVADSSGQMPCVSDFGTL